MVSMKNLSLAMAALLTGRTLAIPGEAAIDSTFSADGAKRGIQEGLILRSINSHLFARTDEARDGLEERDLKERSSEKYLPCCLFPTPGKGRGRRARDVNDLEERDLDTRAKSNGIAKDYKAGWVRKPNTSSRFSRRALAGRGRHTRDVDDIEKSDVNDRKKTTSKTAVQRNIALAVFFPHPMARAVVAVLLMLMSSRRETPKPPKPTESLYLQGFHFLVAFGIPFRLSCRRHALPRDYQWSSSFSGRKGSCVFIELAPAAGWRVVL